MNVKWSLLKETASNFKSFPDWLRSRRPYRYSKTIVRELLVNKVKCAHMQYATTVLVWAHDIHAIARWATNKREVGRTSSVKCFYLLWNYVLGRSSLVYCCSCVCVISICRLYNLSYGVNEYADSLRIDKFHLTAIIHGRTIYTI